MKGRGSVDDQIWVWRAEPASANFPLMCDRVTSLNYTATIFSCTVPPNHPIATPVIVSHTATPVNYVATPVDCD